MRLRQRLLATTMLAGVLGIYSGVKDARAADLNLAPLYAQTPWAAPAVDGVNGRLEGIGGSLDSKSLAGSQGAIALPLGGALGFQLDGASGSLQSRAFESVTGHLFARNPFRGLLGAYVNYTNWDQFGGVHATQAAGEFEAYFGRWTLRGIVGAEFGNSASTYFTTTGVIPAAVGIPGLVSTTTFAQGYDVKTRFMDQVNLQYYLTDNWDAYVGHRYVGGQNALALGSEIGLPLGRGMMASAFVEGRVGSERFEGRMGRIARLFRPEG